MTTIYTNARIVTATEIVAGTLLVADGEVHAIEPGNSDVAGAIDLDGDLIVPGLVELHTDNLERHTTPRPKVRWPTAGAVMAHDAQMAAAGITTVLDAVRLGRTIDDGEDVHMLAGTIDAISRAQRSGLTRAAHFLHLRCEVACADTAEQFRALADASLLRLVSIMDHTPGQRQFVDPERLRVYYTRKYAMSDAAFDAFTAERQAMHERYAAKHRAEIVAISRAKGLALASHDDATPAHVDEAVADGMTIAEFPTTIEAAALSHRQGMAVLVGGPNIVLGGSHSGNIAAADLVRAGVADIVSSDYVPTSLMHAAFMLADDGIGVPAALAMVSRNPARAIGLEDRGELAQGQLADFARVRVDAGVPQIRAVWRQGQRVV